MTEWCVLVLVRGVNQISWWASKYWEKALTSTFSMLKAPTQLFTIKGIVMTLFLNRYFKWVF